MPRAKKKKLGPLTALRFFAAAMIVLHHSQNSFGLSNNFFVSWQLGQGVSFFFVLSGFILTYVYPHLNGTSQIGHFLWARFSRVWPMHALTALVFVGLFSVPFWKNPGLLISASNLVMVHGWIPLWDYFFSLNSPSWSISTEIFFYLCFPLLLVRWEETWHIKLLLIFSLLIGLIVFCNSAKLPQATANYRGVSSSALLYIHPLGRVFEFVLGMATAIIWQKNAARIRIGTGAFTIIEFLMLCLVVISNRLSLSWSFIVKSWLGPAGALWFQQSGSALFFAVLIFVMAMEKGRLSRLFALPFFVLLGEISYSMYLIHQIIIRYYHRYDTIFSGVSAWFAYPVYWILLLCTSYVSWHFFERPCRHFLVKLWPGPQGLPSGREQLVTSTSSRMADAPQGFLRPRYAAVIMVAIIMALVAYIKSLPPLSNLRLIDRNHAIQISAESREGTRNLTFDDRFVLWGLRTRRDINGVVIEMAWESLRSQRLKFNVALHLLDASGALIETADYAQDPNKGRVKQGTIWLDVITIPHAKLSNVASFGLGLYKPPSSLMKIDRGIRDWDGHRLIVSLRENSN